MIIIQALIFINFLENNYYEQKEKDFRTRHLSITARS